jgi:hypothetical protein
LESVSITLETGEAQFLVTVVKSPTAILTALLALQKSVPELPPSPINETVIASIAAMAENIERQIDPLSGQRSTA